MRWFQKILVVIGQGDIPKVLFDEIAQVIAANEAEVTFLMIHPKLPGEMHEFQLQFEKMAQDNIKAGLAAHNLNISYNFVVETQKPYYISIIKRVIREDYDLIIKPEDKRESKERGFKSLDMSLLRKAPCPVWIYRDMESEKQPNILTAIDPLDEEPVARDLAIKLLRLGSALSEELGAKHYIISCWEVEHENFMRTSGFAKMEDETISQIIMDTQETHKKAFQYVMQKADIEEPDRQVLAKGPADKMISDYIAQKDIDLVVMGTVGRTGIPGYFIGNTAENILQNVGCSLFAVKPPGFQSPVKTD